MARKRNRTKRTNTAKSNPAPSRNNPVSYNARLASSALTTSRTYSGKDIIVTDFTGTSSFGASDYALNPRLPDKFPSASFAAQRYDMYQFEELVFHYHPTTAVTTSKGVMFLAWEPNANKGPPDTIAQINAFESHSQGPIYNPSISLRVPKNKLGPTRYCRAGPTGSDLNLYDTGRLIVASDDVVSGEGGYVEVSYRIRFFNYHLEETSSVQSRMAASRLIISDQPLTTGVPEIVSFNGLAEDFNGDDLFNVDLGLISLPKGKYFINATIMAKDSANERFEVRYDLRKNGSTLSVPCFVRTSYAPPGAGLPIYATETITCIVDSDGTDTYDILATLVGATGTLSIIREATRVQIAALS